MKLKISLNKKPYSLLQINKALFQAGVSNYAQLFPSFHPFIKERDSLGKLIKSTQQELKIRPSFCPTKSSENVRPSCKRQRSLISEYQNQKADRQFRRRSKSLPKLSLYQLVQVNKAKQKVEINKCLIRVLKLKPIQKTSRPAIKLVLESRPRLQVKEDSFRMPSSKEIEKVLRKLPQPKLNQRVEEQMARLKQSFLSIRKSLQRISSQIQIK